MSMHNYQSNPMCTHAANDLIEAVAFGFASEEEQQLVREHVATCEICAEALREARFAAEALPLAAPDAGNDHHEAIWAKIQSNIEADTATEQPQALSSPASPAPAKANPFRVHWAVAAVIALLTLAGGVFLGQALFENDTSDKELVAQVQVTDPEIAATGTVQYDPDQGVMVLRMEDMPAAPEGFVYQVWVITGETPVSVGTMDPQSSEFATARNPQDYQTLAITLEEGPMGNEQPTTEPIVVADLTQLVDD